MSKLSFKSMPIPLLKYCGKGIFVSPFMRFTAMDSATEYLLLHDTLDSYRLKWWGNGWVVYYQESYLCKDYCFKHKNDIPSFKHSMFGEAEGWNHVFETREDAIYYMKLTWVKLHDDNNPEYLKEIIKAE